MQKPPFSRFENYATNPHPDAFPNALKLLKDLAAHDSIWQESGEKDGVIYRHSAVSDKTGVPTVRGDGSIEGYSVEEILAVIHQPSCRAIWDLRYENAFPIEIYNSNLLGFWASMKGDGLLVWPRDLTGILGHVQEKEGDQLVAYYLQTSAEMKGFPELPTSYVRGHLSVAGFILRPVEGTNKVNLTYVVNVDPAGSLPAPFVAMAVIELPVCIARVRDYLKDYGFPPYIPRHAGPFPGTMQDELFDHASNTIAIRWRPEVAGSLRVQYDKSKWTGGAKVSPGEGTSEGDYEIKDGEGYVDIVYGDGVKGKNLAITVKKA